MLPTSRHSPRPRVQLEAQADLHFLRRHRIGQYPVTLGVRGSVGVGVRRGASFDGSGERVSNPRPQAWEACALPTELPPRDPDSRARAASSRGRLAAVESPSRGCSRAAEPTLQESGLLRQSHSFERFARLAVLAEFDDLPVASTRPGRSASTSASSQSRSRPPTAGSSKTGSPSHQQVMRARHGGARLEVIFLTKRQQRGRDQPQNLRFSSSSPAPTTTLPKRRKIV